MRREFDVIVVGAGVNGLACGAYLARAGLEVAVVERRNECGPFALTEDLFGAGVPIDTHAGVCFVTMSPALGELELDRFGLDLIFPRVPTGTVFKDDTNLIYYPDLDATCQAMDRYSQRDARTHRKLRETIQRNAVEMLERGVFSPPSEEGLEYLWNLGSLVGFSPGDFRTMNAFEYLDLLYEHERVKCSLLGQAAIGIFGDPAEKGEGAVMALLGQACSFGVPRGGMHTLVHALVRCFRQHGGTLLLNAPVEKIEFEGEHPRWVHLAESSPIPEKKLRARDALIVHVSPPLGLEMLGDEPLRSRDRELWRRMKDWDMTGHCAFTSYVLLRGPARWKSRRWNPDVQECAFPLRAWDSWDHAKRSFQYTKNEEIFDVAGDVGEIYQLCAVDPSRVPADGRTGLVYEVEYPVNLRRHGGLEAWDDRDLTDRLHAEHLQDLRDMIDDFDADLLDSTYFTPIDNWRRNPSAILGHELGGDVSGAQWYEGRMPSRASIAGLYFTQGVWPCSLTHLGSAYVTACAVAEDLGVREQPWWKQRPMQRYIELMFDRAGSDRSVA
jgi:phytoene dehydrogenase-like protein